MSPVPEPRRLPAERACFRSDVRALGIASSADAGPPSALGDPRGEHALAIALNMASAGYHAFVCGVEGPDRLERVAGIARSLLRRDEPPGDWVYVHNFSEPDRPRAIPLRAGDGRRLRGEMESFIRRLRDDLPRAFREETFDREKAELIEAFEERHRAKRKVLEELVTRSGFAIAFTPQQNIALIPVVDGRPIESESDLRSLGEERILALESARRDLEREIREHLEQHRLEQHKLDEEIHGIEREFAERIVRRRARDLAARFESPVLERHVEDLVEHILDHLDWFRGEQQTSGLPFLLAPEPQDTLAVYEVNVTVDNSRKDAPRVLVVDSPTYKNLFGTIDRSVDRTGRLTTDFRRIHAGSLLEADGGVVVLNAEDALVEPFVWRVLRRALRSGRVEIEAYDPFVMFTPAGIRPEPIQVSTKVVLLGPRWLFELLLELDDEFRDLFKVLADFSPVVDREEETTRALCGRVAEVVEAGSLPPFDAGALDAVVELSVREAADRRKLHLGSQRVLDAAREAGTRARASGRSKTTREDVVAATRERVYRLDRIEESLREAVERGLLLVEVEGSRVGQVNALSVAELGGHTFGRPSRVTATVGMGAEGVVSIDRETQLSGSIHDKGVLILQGFLRDRFARNRPLSLVASVAFEQSYAHVEGDSASLAELLAILSQLANVALRQDVAVTGSVNQLGRVQAIGGVNEKVEGFFDCCRVVSATGQQGVIFPAANEEHLALREDVVDALREGCFHLYPVETVDEAFEVLTGREVGSPEQPGTLNFEIDAALERLAREVRRFAELGRH